MGNRLPILALLISLVACTGDGGAPACPPPAATPTPDWAWSVARCACQEIEDACSASCTLAWRNTKGVQQGGSFAGTCEDVPCCSSPK
jgi:hypothetical protein